LIFIVNSKNMPNILFPYVIIILMGTIGYSGLIPIVPYRSLPSLQAHPMKEFTNRCRNIEFNDDCV